MDPEESDIPSRSGQVFRHEKIATAMEYDEDRVRLAPVGLNVDQINTTNNNKNVSFFFPAT